MLIITSMKLMLRRHCRNPFAWSRKQKELTNFSMPLSVPSLRSRGRAPSNASSGTARGSEGLRDQPWKCVLLTLRGQVQNPGDPYIACAFPRCLFSFKVSSEREGKKASCVPISFSVDISLYPLDISDKEALSHLKELFGRQHVFFY